MSPGSPVGPEDDRFYTRCHFREKGNPGVLKSLHHIDFSFLDLRVKPEDDKPTLVLSFP